MTVTPVDAAAAPSALSHASPIVVFASVELQPAHWLYLRAGNGEGWLSRRVHRRAGLANCAHEHTSSGGKGGEEGGKQGRPVAMGVGGGQRRPHIQSISTPASMGIARVLLRSRSCQKRSSDGSARPPCTGWVL